MNVSSTREPRPLFVEWHALPPPGDHGFPALVRRGIRGIFVRPALHLSDERPAELLHFLWLLREAAGAGLRVDWQGHVRCSFAHTLVHLDPPVLKSGGRQWPIANRPLLTARYGPGFVRIVDERTEPRHEVVNDSAEVVALIRHAEVTTEDDQTIPDRLLAAGYVVGAGGLHLTIPVRPGFTRTSNKYPAVPCVS